MSVINTQLEIMDNILIPLVNFNNTIENTIDWLAVADPHIDTWDNNTPQSNISEVSNKLEGNMPVQVDFNINVNEMGTLVDEVGGVTDSEISVRVSENIGVNDVVRDRLVGVESVKSDVTYEMTDSSLLNETQLIKDNVSRVGSTSVDSTLGLVVDDGVQVVNDCIVETVENVVMISDTYGETVQYVIGEFGNVSSIVENIVNEIPTVNSDTNSNANNNVMDTYVSKHNSKVAENVVSNEMLEIINYQGDMEINNFRDNVEAFESVMVNEVDRKYMLDSVTASTSKLAASDVNVTVNNNNNISSEVDANAIIAKLSDGIKQAMNVAVSGVYA